MGLFPVPNNTSLYIQNSEIGHFNLEGDNVIYSVPPVDFKVKLLVPSAKAPKRALPLDNGMDLFLMDLHDHIPDEEEQFHFDTHTKNCVPFCDEQGKVIGIEIYRNGMAKLPLGIATSFNPYWGAFVFDKSGVGSKGIKYLGGVIESNYRGPWWVMLANIGGDYDEPVKFQFGQKIAQVCFLPVGRDEAKIVSDLDETERKSGFGSTGEF